MKNDNHYLDAVAEQVWVYSTSTAVTTEFLTVLSDRLAIRVFCSLRSLISDEGLVGSLP